MKSLLAEFNPLDFGRRYRGLRDLGIMGMNQRNHCYIGQYNDRSLFPIVDNKLKTKELALDYQLTTPKLIGVIENQHDVAGVATLVSSSPGFCIKPAKGSGGKGILVIKDSREGEFQRSQ